MLTSDSLRREGDSTRRTSPPGRQPPESAVRCIAIMRAFRPNSAMIKRVLFDEEAATLCISFHQSGQYVYDGVPRAVYDALASASSAGSFFNEAIKGRFPCRPARRRHRPED